MRSMSPANSMWLPALRFLGMCALLLFLPNPTLAQNPRELQEGGAIVIQDRALTVRVGSSITPRPDTIPPDEALLKIELSELLLAQVARLDHAEYDQREAAMEALIEEPGDDLRFFALLARSSELAISPEQHNRLMAVLRERIMNTPGGALGISLQPQQNIRDGRVEIEVEVRDLLPGLPAIELLHIGDRITAIDGQPFEGSNDLTTRIQMHKPGDVVTLTVVRRKRDAHGRFIVNEQGGMELERLEIPVELGSTEHLRDPETGRPQISPFVAEQRRQEMREAERRFRREPLRIEIDGELPGLSPTARRMLEGERNQDVERHPAIQFLRRYREFVEVGTIAFDAALLQEQLNMLRLELRRPGLGDQDRELLEQVIDRYVELMMEF